MAIETRIYRDSSVVIKCTIDSVPNREWYTQARDFSRVKANFSRRKPKVLDVTPFELDVFDHNKRIYHRGNRHGDIGFVYNSSSPESRQYTNDGQLALARARHKLSGSTGDLGESLVELDQTVRMIKNRANSVANIFQALKDGNFNRLESLIKGEVPSKVTRMKPSKRLANGFLEVKFGWLPLLGSAFDAYNAYEKGILGKGTTVRASSGFKYKGVSPFDMWDHRYNMSRATVRGVVHNSNIATANRSGLINPFMMAWQRLPYSFVIDWFLPIGTALGSLSAEAGYTQFIQSRTSALLSILRIPTSDDQLEDYKAEIYYRRHRHTGIPLVNPFGKDAQLSIGQLISSIALIRQRFR